MQNNIFPTLFVGQNIEKLREVDSTNSYLKLLLSNCEPPPFGTVIMADTQLAGRGQRQNRWRSMPGKNLTVSIFLDTEFIPLSKQFSLNKAISLALADCLTQFLPEHCKVKWPNDIYVTNKKISGILIENRVKGNYLKDSVIGIGLNVNQDYFEGLPNATSICAILRQELDLELVLKQLCIAIEHRYLELKSGATAKQDNDYLNCLFRYNEEAFFMVGTKTIKGIISGVDNSGKLQIVSGGQEKAYSMKEVSFLI